MITIAGGISKPIFWADKIIHRKNVAQKVAHFVAQMAPVGVMSFILLS
ncbi:hypothetical protein [Thioclava sp. GXIMD4215]